MGSGKSSLHKSLSHKLNYTAIDLDNYIEIQQQKSISELFKECGEEEFRSIEKKALHEVSLQNNIVVATGGGTPCFYNNINFMNNCGTTIYLEMTPEALVCRLLGSKKKRPLINSFNESELLIFIQQQLKIRSEFYNLAHYKINGINLKADKVLKMIQKNGKL
ncbi:MAG: shikimate kinase [Marinilabiliales bacterium]|nr:MAG: shikimate kinase [Marinilabiliales bacterium]